MDDGIPWDFIYGQWGFTSFINGQWDLLVIPLDSLRSLQASRNSVFLPSHHQHVAVPAQLNKCAALSAIGISLVGSSGISLTGNGISTGHEWAMGY